MTQQVYISDTNIWIDFRNAGLLDALLSRTGKFQDLLIVRCGDHGHSFGSQILSDFFEGFVRARIWERRSHRKHDFVR